MACDNYGGISPNDSIAKKQVNTEVLKKAKPLPMMDHMQKIDKSELPNALAQPAAMMSKLSDGAARISKLLDKYKNTPGFEADIQRVSSGEMTKEQFFEKYPVE